MRYFAMFTHPLGDRRWAKFVSTTGA